MDDASAEPSIDYMASVYPNYRMNELQWEYEAKQTAERARIISSGGYPGERIPPPESFRWVG